MNRAPSPRSDDALRAALIALATFAVYFVLIRHAFGPHSPSKTFLLICFKTLILPAGFWFAVEQARSPEITLLPPPSLEPALTRALLPLSCAFLAGFIFLVGNHQYGAWDFNVIVDTGWREYSGQRPYVDFITPNPPGFNLGALYAYRLFGVTWNAILLWTALFSLVTFTWSYALCRALTMRPFAAWLAAFYLQCVTLIPTDFWWYNSTTALLGCIFLLSVYCCVQNGTYKWAAWTSYALSLALLVLEKPNTAGLLTAGGCVLALIAAPAPRWKMMAWTAAAALMALLLLWSHHISIFALLAAYRAAAIERGGLNAFALKGIGWPGRWQTALIPVIASAPILAAAPVLWRAWQKRDWRAVAQYLLLVLPIPVTAYGIATDAEVRENESAIIFVAAATAVFGLRLVRPRLTRMLVASQFAIILTMVLLGHMRGRVHDIGPGQFYEPQQNRIPIRDEFFTSLDATPRMQRVQDEVHRAAAALPKPMFFGPRLEFEYADMRLASPRGWTVYYHPGTSFARKNVDQLNHVWQGEHFQTLVFLGDDRTFYPPGLLAMIDRDYKRIPGFAELQVYVRREQ